MIHWLQRFIFTRWMWRFYQHEETGRMVMVPRWRHPGQRWYPVRWKE